MMSGALPAARTPKTEDFRRALAERLAHAERDGQTELEVTSGDLHREVGGYPGVDPRMPMCCRAMRAAMEPGDAELSAPPKGDGATLVIRYRLPRSRSA
ncbi:hypothetical protein GCM10008179_06660 [Hansschlegelia plantiphila]|uniref:Uncharacterized protein n=1 Tax=Hansschlegelia plantiphila TaxID=374655 RepID=A0A9W6J087_9HYPH|nr:hypothetical protein GCM10008179_06660 [Hansschlegelia plantiphila]